MSDGELEFYGPIELPAHAITKEEDARVQAWWQQNLERFGPILSSGLSLIESPEWVRNASSAPPSVHAPPSARDTK